MNDRVLRNVVVGLGSKMDGMVREDHFVITVASEIMAVLCLADDMEDLKRRLGNIIVAYNFEGKPVTADDLHATGSMAALLKDCLLYTSVWYMPITSQRSVIPMHRRSRQRTMERDWMDF